MESFETYKDKHKGCAITVCGLGGSLRLFTDKIQQRSADFLTIGVNDIERAFTPTYLLNVNARSSYTPERYGYIEASKAKAIFTHMPEEQPKTDVPIITFKLANADQCFIDGDRLPWYKDTPYVGVALAAYMGAKRIGLIGVDFTPNHFWAEDGNHPLHTDVELIDARYGMLAAWLEEQGVEVFNLSPTSRLKTLNRMDFDQWT